MKVRILNKNVYFEQFIPPVLHRAIHRLKYGTGTFKRIHPFDCVPKSLQAKWILDIGANIGDIAIAALESYEDSSVICFEPVSRTFNILKKRLKQYKNRSFLYNKALSDINGETEINVTNFHGANSILPQSEFHKYFNPKIYEIRKEIIACVKLDDFAINFPNQKIDIMKIDVEGYEINVLRGGQNFIKNHVDTIVIEISFIRDTSWEQQSIFDIFLFLKNAGFSLINVYDINRTEKTDMILTQMDCVFCHKSKLRMQL